MPQLLQSVWPNSWPGQARYRTQWQLLVQAECAAWRRIYTYAQDIDDVSVSLNYSANDGTVLQLLDTDADIDAWHEREE